MGQRPTVDLGQGSGGGAVGRLKARRARARRKRERIPARTDAVVEALPGAVIARGLDGVIGTWNSAAQSLYGYSAAEALGTAYERLVPGVWRGREAEIAGEVTRAEVSDCYRAERVAKDGSVADVSVQISPVRDRAGNVVAVTTVEQAAQVSARDPVWSSEVLPHLLSAFEQAPVSIALVSVDAGSEGRLVRVNRALCMLTGYPAERLESTTVRALLHPEDIAADEAAMARLLDGKVSEFQLEQRLCHAERHDVWVLAGVSLVRDEVGRPLYCIRQAQDIEERKRYEGELGSLLEHDPLTGLLNRRGFVRELTQHMAEARRYGGGGCILFFDLDDFKWVNDTLGHRAGDEVISDVARIVLHQLRETDVFARLGGDEFAVLLPHASSGEARTVSRKLLDAVRESCALTVGGGRRVTISVGVAAFDVGEYRTADDILHDADIAMYAAKESGKDRATLACASINEHRTVAVTWSERVRSALQNDMFELYCQPIVDLARNQVSQWELLLRLPGEQGELILPTQFLYTAERSGLIVEIDRWVVGEAMRLVASQRDAGHDLHLEVNISGRSVGDEALLELIERGLETLAIDPASLIIEITETAAIANMDRARNFATRLRALGCRFALDDFGAGFGSFYYLKHIPFDFVKIDGEFVRNLPTSNTDQLILDSIVQMSRGLGKRTIAEYVGDLETVEALKAHGVDYGQGFHLGTPIPVPAMLALAA
jgi:diguanylate cyclase (GGDEF)-like protein/PAS domain S-box-containing protein